MTNTRDTIPKGANWAFRSSRTARTFRLTQLMEEAERLAIGERIKQLREQSPYTQPAMADLMGLTLRGYQKLEEKGTTIWDHAKTLAKIHDVDVQWIWTGREGGASADLADDIAEIKAWMERIEKVLETLGGELSPGERATAAARKARQAARKQRADTPAGTRPKRATGSS